MRAWARASWIDRAVAIALILLALASLCVRPVWRAVDPGLALAMAVEEWHPRMRGASPLPSPVEQRPDLRDRWGRPAWLLSVSRVRGLGGRPDGWIPDWIVSAGPNGELETVLPDETARPRVFRLGGDDVLARLELLPWHRLALVAPFLVLGLAISYRVARTLRPIPSPGRDLVASLLTSLPACLPLLALGLILARLEPDATARLPWASGSVFLTLLGALTVMVFAVRRHHAPLEPPPPKPSRTEADLEAELRALVDAP